MNRRSFLAQSASIAALPALTLRRDRQQSFLLSRHGCGRATGYSETNKIITHQGKTHVSWLDSEAGEGFRVRIRTLDHATGIWSGTVTVGGAADNHGGPALTIDGQGFLHLVYGPHHHPMRYRRSRWPNDSTDWMDEIQFGENLTYPTLVCDTENNLIVTCRRSYSDRPWEMELWSKPAGSDSHWSFGATLARSRHPGYAHFQEGLVWSPDRKTLHLFCRFHELTDEKGYGRIQNLAYLRSPDRGQTWHRFNGDVVELPATAETADILASGGKDVDRDLRIGGLAVGTDGDPVVYYSVLEPNRGEIFLASPDGDGAWQSVSLRRFVPRQFEGWRLLSPGGLTFAQNGTLFLAAQLYFPDSGDSTAWGHPTTEVCALKSKDNGYSFDFELITGLEMKIPSWLPSLERPTGFNNVPNSPGMIYTRGGRGEKNTDILSNEVIWRPLI